MTNFDYLKSEKEFESFVDIAITAEKYLILTLELVFLIADVQWKWQSNGCILSIMI